VTLLSERRSHDVYGQPPLHECVTGDKCEPSWLATSGPAVFLPYAEWGAPARDPEATVLVSTRVVFGGILRATPGDYITPAQAAEWGLV
jgi:hypothetical protein